MKRVPAALLFFALSLLMNIPWLGMTPLSGTEGHRALTADEMVRTHQWLLPVLYGRPYLAKPPFHHWLIATSQTLGGGPGLVVWRLPSAINGAILCAACCYFAARWFGNLAGLISGGISLGMIALWGEHQVADIDSTDTTAATLAAFFAIEALYGRRQHRWVWIVAAGLANAATWMTKGPAGLPIIAGLALYPLCENVLKSIYRNKRRSLRYSEEPGFSPPDPALRRTSETGVTVLNPTPGSKKRKLFPLAAWLPLLIGVVLFATYLAAGWFGLQRLGLGKDLSGLQEGVQSMHPGSLRQVLWAMALPPTVFFYALPGSLALPLSFWKEIRRGMGSGRQRRIAGAITGAVLISWGICLLSGMTNPRYAYPTIGVLGPLAGAVAAAGLRAGTAATAWVRGIALGSAVAMGGAGVGLSFLALREQWKFQHEQSTLAFAMSALLSILLAGWIVGRLSRGFAFAWALVVLTVVVSVPFGFERSFARTASSGKEIAGRVGPLVGNGVIAQGMSLTFKPEIFYYAHKYWQTRTIAYLPHDFTPEHVPPGSWLFLTRDEYANWKRQAGNHIQQAREVARGGGEPYYLAYYSKR